MKMSHSRVADKEQENHFTSTVVSLDVLQLLHGVQTAVGDQGRHRIQEAVDACNTARLTDPLLQLQQSEKCLRHYDVRFAAY